jgi:hypothetical protein
MSTHLSSSISTALVRLSQPPVAVVKICAASIVRA